MNLKPANILYTYLNMIQFDIHNAMMNYKLERISSLIKGRWLDIGAGEQPYRKHFGGASEYLTTNTKRHYSAQQIEILDKLTTYWIEDGKQLPVADQSLDGVACFQVLSVIEKPDVFFKEIVRVLKPGGKLVLTTDFLYPVWSSEDRNRHTAFNLEALALENGMSVVSVESFGAFGSTMYSVFMRYVRSFPEIWKGKGVLSKIITAIAYLFILLVMPIASLKGWIIYLIERNQIKNTDFTFNIMLVAEKK